MKTTFIYIFKRQIDWIFTHDRQIIFRVMDAGVYTVSQTN